MDPSLWSNLPEQLLERIVACLPATSLFRFCILSKSWNSLLSSSHFLCLHSTMTLTQSPLFLMFGDRNYRDSPTYDPLTNRWYQIPLPSSPDFERRCIPDFEPRCIPFASAGGLICFASIHSAGRMPSIVCNPLTRAWRKLPPTNNTLTGRIFGGMVADKDTNSYSVVVASKHMGKISTEVYDSIQDKWKTTCQDLDPLQDTDFCDGFVYDGDGYGSLLAYSLREESWSSVRTPTIRYWENNRIARWKGHLFVVGQLRDSICIWELHAPKSGCVKVDTMPDNLRRKFLRRGDHVSSVGCNGFLLLYVDARLPMFLYDISKKLWRRLPSCTLAGQYFGISYEPSLYAAT